MATPPPSARRATGSKIKPLKPPSQQQPPPLSPSATAAEVSRLKTANAELSAKLADVNARIAVLEAAKREREQRRSPATATTRGVKPTVVEEENEGERQRGRAQRDRERERQHQRERERRHAERTHQRSTTPLSGRTDTHRAQQQEQSSAVPAAVHADVAQRPLSYRVRPLSMLPPSSTLAEELAATLEEEAGEEDEDEDEEAVFHEARMFIPTPRPSPGGGFVSPGGGTPSPSPGHGARSGRDTDEEREDAASAAARSDEYATALAKLQGNATSEGSASARKTVAGQMLRSAGRAAGEVVTGARRGGWQE